MYSVSRGARDLFDLNRYTHLYLFFSVPGYFSSFFFISNNVSSPSLYLSLSFFWPCTSIRRRRRRRKLFCHPAHVPLVYKDSKVDSQSHRHIVYIIYIIKYYVSAICRKRSCTILLPPLPCHMFEVIRIHIIQCSSNAKPD